MKTAVVVTEAAKTISHALTVLNKAPQKERCFYSLSTLYKLPSFLSLPPSIITPPPPPLSLPLYPIFSYGQVGFETRPGSQ